jgi:hypothetical protein
MTDAYGITSFNGVLRSTEMKFRQTGNRMKMASTWSTRAAARAIAERETAIESARVSRSGWSRNERTEGDAKGGSSGDEVVLQLVVQEAEPEDDQVEEQPDGIRDPSVAYSSKPSDWKMSEGELGRPVGGAPRAAEVAARRGQRVEMS